MNTEMVDLQEDSAGPKARKAALFLFLLALSVGGGASAYAAETAHARTIEAAACPFVLPYGIHADCGFLVVPEKRSFDGEERGPSVQTEIRIAFMVARSPYGNPAPDPIVYVTGGPSAAAISPGNVSYLASLFLAASRDLILVDQRGTGISRPRLDCPEFDALSAATFPNAPSRPTYLASVRAQRPLLARLREFAAAPVSCPSRPEARPVTGCFPRLRETHAHGPIAVHRDCVLSGLFVPLPICAIGAP